jgi:argininosuccinate synthase
MFKAYSDEVFEFLRNYEDEVHNWEVLVWPRSDGVTVHDARRSVYKMTDEKTATFERHDLSDQDQARKFISCKAIAFALNKYEEHRSANS